MDVTLFKPLLRIHDEDGQFLILLKANGFQVDANQVELLMCMSKWHRMVKAGDKIPRIDIANISKFRDFHIGFLNNHADEMKAKAMEKIAAVSGDSKQEIIT